MKIILFIIMSKSREHVKHYKNVVLTITKLLKQYETTNLIIIDIFFSKNMSFQYE